ncbi:hypothetical protein BT69DRAFT_1298900 [Atractiella rhizophila]|nr:hypothetical protein BT69DRAFT_1298900 [Atractiella rhizophila]
MTFLPPDQSTPTRRTVQSSLDAFHALKLETVSHRTTPKKGQSLRFGLSPRNYYIKFVNERRMTKVDVPEDDCGLLDRHLYPAIEVFQDQKWVPVLPTDSDPESLRTWIKGMGLWEYRCLTLDHGTAQARTFSPIRGDSTFKRPNPIARWLAKSSDGLIARIAQAYLKIWTTKSSDSSADTNPAESESESHELVSNAVISPATSSAEHEYGAESGQASIVTSSYASDDAQVELLHLT